MLNFFYLFLNYKILLKLPLKLLFLSQAVLLFRYWQILFFRIVFVILDSLEKNLLIIFILKKNFANKLF